MQHSTAATDVFDFTGRRALVTGGEGGIPRATAILLAALGADVAVASIGEGLDATVAEIEGHGRAGYSLRADLSEAAQCQIVVDEAAQMLGGLDSVVNAAGGSWVSKAIPEWTPKDFDALVDVNLRAAFFVSQASVALLLAAGGGAIVNVSSSAGSAPVPPVLPYGAAKAGLENLTMTMASELGARGIRVNAVAPGPTKSGRFLRNITAQGLDPDEAAGGSTAMNRVGDPEEQAWPIAFLLSDAAAYVNGTTLHVDGGRPTRT